MLGCSHVNAYVIYVVVNAAGAAAVEGAAAAGAADAAAADSLVVVVVVHLVVVMLGGKMNITFFFFGKCATQLFQLCCLLHLIALLLGQVKPKPQPPSSLTSCVIVRFTTLASTWKLMQLLAKRCKTLTCIVDRQLSNYCTRIYCEQH